MLLFKFGCFTILIVRDDPERASVRRSRLNLSKTGYKRFLRPLINSRHTRVDRISHLVAAVIVEGPWDGVFGLALRSALPDVSMAFLGHGSDHTCAFRIEECGFFGCGEVTRWIVGHFELTFNIVKVEHCLLDVTFCIGVIGAVLRLQALIVLVRQHLVLSLDATRE